MVVSCFQPGEGPNRGLLCDCEHFVSSSNNATHYCYSHLTDEQSWRQEGVFKSFVGYAAFTTLDFPFEVYLAARFFLARDGGAETALRR